LVSSHHNDEIKDFETLNRERRRQSEQRERVTRTQMRKVEGNESIEIEDDPLIFAILL
jgi:hypothetical protein